MMNASLEFKDLIRNGAKIVNYADITLRNGTVLNLTPEDFSVGGFTIVDETTDGKFGMGNAISKQISIIISNHIDQYSNYDFYKAIIHMYVAVHTSDGRILKERKGKYYVINPTSPGDVIKISGVDSMYLFDKPYNTATGYPATLQSILSCSKILKFLRCCPGTFHFPIGSQPVCQGAGAPSRPDTVYPQHKKSFLNQRRRNFIQTY